MKYQLLTICLILVISQSQLIKFLDFEQNNNCWKDAYGRGVGKPISSCKEGFEKNGALCYPLCKEGYTGVGPVCWQNCPAGFRDDGAYCAKPAPYGRGAGYAIWDEDKCERENPIGCEKWGAMWYPKCKPGYHNVACCVCSPDCEDGMLDIGVSCQKNSYGRGAGVPLSCKSDEQYDAGLCYPYCKEHYSGIGPVCWANCPNGMYDCSALCTPQLSDCNDTIKKMLEDCTVLTAAIAEAAITGEFDIRAIIKALGPVAEDFANGICPAIQFGQ